MENKSTNNAQPQTSKKIGIFNGEFTESSIWMIVAFAISSQFIYDLTANSFSLSEAISYNIFPLSISAITIIFPYLYYLVFTSFPVESILRSRSESKKLYSKDIETRELGYYTEALGQLIQKNEILDSNGIDYLTTLTINSKKLSRTIFTRSGTYLLIGGIFAISGIIFFYLSTPDYKSTLHYFENGNQELISTVKHFGILFFIEFIAFYFLKQYRSSMDEFRYYESLQRHREDTLAMMKFYLSERQADNKDFIGESKLFSFVEKCGFRTSIDKLENGQSTDILETKKLNKDETEIFNKILDILGKK